MALDITKRATLRPAMDEVEAKLGPIDILVNNAGISVIITRTPAGRFGELEEMAGTAVFLASDASNFVTGEVV